MNDAIGARAPAWLRIVAALGVLWNGYGCYAYLQTVGVLDGAMEGRMGAMPAWVTGAFAIAVFGGVLGCIGLLLLKGWARPLLILSLLGVLAEDVWLFAMSGAAPSGNALVLPVLVTLISLLLAWVANDAAKKGWLA